jgi:gluconate kinase
MTDDQRATLQKLFEQGLDNSTIKKRVTVTDSTLKRRRREWLKEKEARKDSE